MAFHEGTQMQVADRTTGETPELEVDQLFFMRDANALGTNIR
jgi:hypothetical protein